jgi:hypothetical protein
MQAFTVQNRKFILDQFNSVYESFKDRNVFFCKLNGRTFKDAVLEAIDSKEIVVDDSTPLLCHPPLGNNGMYSKNALDFIRKHYK